MSMQTLTPDLTRSIDDHLDPQCELCHDPQCKYPLPFDDYLTPSIQDQLALLDSQLSSLCSRVAELEDCLLQRRDT